MKRVVITGTGVISPLGNDPELFFDALIHARSGLTRLAPSWADALATPYAGIVQGDVESSIPKIRRNSMDRVTLLALLAARQATRQAGLVRAAVPGAARSAHTAFDDAAGEQTGLYWSTGMGGAHALEAAYHELLVTHAARLRPATIVMVMNNAATGQIAIDLNIRGPSYTYSSACSSSAVAIGEAFRAVRFGLVKTAIAGGSEALLSEGVMKAWESLGTLARMGRGGAGQAGQAGHAGHAEHAALTANPLHTAQAAATTPSPPPAPAPANPHASASDPATACRPFAADRSGFLLGEGAAALVLEEREAALARGATILGEITGFGNTTDAGHITQPDAGGQARAMRLALAEAGLAPEQIDHINAHGTGTKVGDVSETQAIHSVFGNHAPRIPISATKALHGHLMGAAGALECIATLLALRERRAPPTAHLWHPDPACDLDYVPLRSRTMPAARIALSNSFGFGGNNAVLVVQRQSA